MKTKMHNGSRLLSLLLAVVLVFTLTEIGRAHV